jgi:hypothetical protein
LGELGDSNGSHPTDASALGDSRSMPKLAGCQLMVVDDLPTAIPVTIRELELLEAYLGAVLDDLFKDASSSADSRTTALRGK